MEHCYSRLFIHWPQCVVDAVFEIFAELFEMWVVLEKGFQLPDGSEFRPVADG